MSNAKKSKEQLDPHLDAFVTRVVEAQTNEAMEEVLRDLYAFFAIVCVGLSRMDKAQTRPFDILSHLTVGTSRVLEVFEDEREGGIWG